MKKELLNKESLKGAALLFASAMTAVITTLVFIDGLNDFNLGEIVFGGITAVYSWCRLYIES